jgi:hypothetical protein
VFNFWRDKSDMFRAGERQIFHGGYILIYKICCMTVFLGNNKLALNYPGGLVL